MEGRLWMCSSDNVRYFMFPRGEAVTLFPVYFFRGLSLVLLLTIVASCTEIPGEFLDELRCDGGGGTVFIAERLKVLWLHRLNDCK